jgi:hypothetical protein
VFREALNKVVDAAALGQGNQAAPQLDAAMQELSDLAEHVLSDRGGSRGRARRILARAARIERGEPLGDDTPDGGAAAAAAAAATTSAGAAPRRRAPTAARRVLSAEQRMANRVQQHMHRGSVSRAARTLKDVPMADLNNPAMLERLASKHPHAPPPEPLETDEPALQIDAATLRTVLARWRGKKGTAAGLSGLTPEHIVAAAEASVLTLESLLAFVNLVLSGKMPRHATLLDSALIGLMKPNGDVRPIAIGEVLYRLVACCALAAIGHTGDDLCPFQVGAGVSSGAEAAAHAVKAALAKDAQAVVVNIDIRNAFNTLGRDAILRAVKDACPALLPFVTWAYGAATDLVVVGADVDPLKSATGVRQGDPLSTWLFAQAFQPVLRAAAEVIPTVAFVDDGNLVGSAEQALAAVPIFLEMCKADGRGLEVQPAKCQVYSPDHAVGAAVAAELEFEHAKEGIVAFGTPIGEEAFIAATVEARADSIIAEIDRLMALPAPVTLQMKWRMLQASLAVRMEHLKRTVPWELLAASTRRVERAVQGAAAVIFQLPADAAGAEACKPALLQQMTLPLRWAGFGLRTASEDSADAALLSGAAAAQAAMADGEAAFRPLDEGSAARAGLLPRWQRLFDGYGEQCEWPAEARDLPAEFVAEKLPGAGHDVSRAADDARGAAMLADCDLATSDGENLAARLRSGAGCAAGAWLQAMPVVPQTRLSDSDFRLRGRHQLGQGLATAALQPPCTCTEGLASAPDHAMVCDHARGDARLRHDHVVDVWCSNTRKAMFAVSREPRFARIVRPVAAVARAGNRRGDWTALLGGTILVGDVVVTHAGGCNSHAAARTTGAAAKKAEAGKQRAWREIGDAEGMRFVALAMETYGRHGSEAIKLMNEMGDAVAQRGGCKPMFMRAFRTELSCALTRGLGRMYRRTEANVIRAAGDHFEQPHDVVISDHCEA